MDHLPLSAIIQKYTGRSEEELRKATWDEIDAISRERNGTTPLLQQIPDLLYTGSPYVMTGRFGSLDESRERWNKIGEAD